MDNPHEYKYPTSQDITDMRTSVKLSQHSLSHLAGVSPLTLSRLEDGEGNHNLTTMCKVLGALQLYSVIDNPNMNPDPFDFVIPPGEELMQLRKDMGLSRKELAERSGVDSGVIRALEVRTQNPINESYLDIVEALQEVYDDTKESRQ